LHSILALPLRPPLNIPYLNPSQLDGFLLICFEIGANKLDLDRDGGVEKYGNRGSFTVAA
jgi:hypothetical protein